MSSALVGRRVAILVDEGFERSELSEPRRALVAAGAHTTLIAPRPGMVRGWERDQWGGTFAVELELSLADEADFDALLLPGGVMATDRLRADDAVLRFVLAFFNAGKPVAAIGHGPQILIDASMVRGRTMTSSPSIHRDLVNAGAEWIDEPAIIDRGLITSRSPADLTDFSQLMIDEFAGSGWAANS